jgi:peptidoglycan/LPS O-acetylase OafA/YrhL
MANQDRYKEIDYLRAYAVLFIIILHILGAYQGVSPIFETFFKNTDFGMGVDLFFAISGFVIAKSLVCFWGPKKEEEKKHYLSQSLSFYKKRFLRLWPSAMVWLIISFCCALVFHADGTWPGLVSMIKKLISGAVYMYNFEEYSNPSVLGYFWSLSVEWQFYLVLPIILIFVNRDRFRFGILFAAMVLSIIVMPGGNGWWMLRFDGIVFGVLVYILFVRTGVELPDFKCLGSRIGRAGFTIIMLAGIAVLPTALSPSRFGITVSSFLAAMLVAVAYQNKGYISTFGMRPLIAWLGSRSYSIYLCHFPCLLIARSILARYITMHDVLNPSHFELLLSLTIIIVSVVVFAEITYRLIERPSLLASQKIRLAPYEKPMSVS